MHLPEMLCPFSAIDINSNGFMYNEHLGTLVKNNIFDMEIGDCIPCRYTATTSGAIGNFSELGTCTRVEIPTAGTATPDGTF